MNKIYILVLILLSGPLSGYSQTEPVDSTAWEAVDSTEAVPAYIEETEYEYESDYDYAIEAPAEEYVDEMSSYEMVKINQFKNDNKRQIVSKPDTKAYYSGGLTALLDYIAMNLRTPRLYGSEGQTARYVIIQFVVGKDSSLYNPEILSTSGSTYSINAKDLIEKLPLRFIPAMSKGKPVDSILLLPIRFEYDLIKNRFNYYYNH